MDWICEEIEESQSIAPAIEVPALVPKLSEAGSARWNLADSPKPLWCIEDILIATPTTLTLESSLDKLSIPAA